ncbi:MAG: hypothetical protein AAF383_25810 [Cyanobacteria bacterium P01_A01_bin.83]
MSQFRLKTAKALGFISELQFNLLNLEPTLTPDFLKPSLEPIDLNVYLEHLLAAKQSKYQDDATNKLIRNNVIKGLKSYMTDSVVKEFSEAIKSDKDYEYAKQWWDSQVKPFIPVIKVYKELKSDHKFIRFQAAKLLEKQFQVQIWDKRKNNIDFISINRILAKFIE